MSHLLPSRYLTSEFGEVTKIRGGKRKKYFQVTNFGRNALEANKDERMGFWGDIALINVSRQALKLSFANPSIFLKGE